MNPNFLNEYSLAKDMLVLDARISIVAKETKLTSTFLRKAYFEIHNRSASSGPSRSQPEFMTKSFAKLKESTLYAVFYKLEQNEQNVRRVINGYRRYCKYLTSLSITKPKISFNDAYSISTWIETGVVKIVRCEHCRSAKLTSKELKYCMCCVCRT